jgi:hypothetical protein
LTETLPGSYDRINHCEESGGGLPVAPGHLEPEDGPASVFHATHRHPEAPRPVRATGIEGRFLAMEDMRCVQVPDGLASELAADGFGEVGTFRGVGDQAVLMITSVAANLVTILVAKEQISAFVKGVRAWMTRRTGPAADSEFVLDVSARVGRDQRTLRLVSRRSTAGQPPDIDMAALGSLLKAAFDDAPDASDGPPSGRSRVSGPPVSLS